MAALTFAARINNATGRGIRAITAGMGRIEGANRRVTRSLRTIDGAARRAGAAMARFARGAVRQLDRVRRAAARVGRGLRTAAGFGARGAAAGAAAAGAGIFAGVQFGQQARDLQRWSNILGITVREVDALNRAARRYASDGDVLFEALIATVDKAQAAILQGAEAEEDFFREFGLNAREFIALGTEEQFDAMAQSIRSIEDPTLRAAVASALFGDEAVKLLPVLNRIADEGLRGVTAEAEANAQLLDGPAAAALIRYDDRWKDIRNSLESAARRLLVYASPIFVTFTDWLRTTGIPQLEEYGRKLTDFLAEYTARETVITPFGDRFTLPSQFEQDVAKVRLAIRNISADIEDLDLQAAIREALEVGQETLRLTIDQVIVDISESQIVTDITAKLRSIWEDVERVWDNGPVIQIIRRIFKLLFSPIAQLIGAEIDIALNGVGETFAEKVRSVIDIGLGLALTAVALVLRRRVGLFGGIFRIGLIGGIIGALNQLDPSGITGAIAGLIIGAITLFPDYVIPRVTGIMNSFVRRLGGIFASAIGNNWRVGEVGLRIVYAIRDSIVGAIRYLAGQVGFWSTLGSLLRIARSIAGAFVIAITNHTPTEIAAGIRGLIGRAFAGVIPDIPSPAGIITAVRDRIASLFRSANVSGIRSAIARMIGGALDALLVNDFPSPTAIVNGIRDRFVSLFRSVDVSGIRSALAGALKAVFNPRNWFGLIRGLGIGVVADLIMREILNQFTLGQRLLQLQDDLLFNWEGGFSGFFTRWANFLIDSWTDAANTVIDAINDIVAAITTDIEVGGVQINPFAGALGVNARPLPRIGLRAGRRGQASQSEARERFEQERLGETGGTTEITVNIRMPDGPLTQDAIDRTGEAVNRALALGLIPGLEPR